MTTAIDRFRNRKALPLLLEVPWPSVNEPRFTFKVHRFATNESIPAGFEADGILKKRGIAEDDENYQTERMGALWYALAPIIKRHIKGWVDHAPEDTEKASFSKEVLDGIFSEMSFAEQMALGMNYMLAAAGQLVTDADKKKEPQKPQTDDTPTVSSTD